MNLTGFSNEELSKMIAGISTSSASTPGGEAKGSLSDKFLVPPFSILDTKQGYWQKRKREWLNMGISSEEGRSDDLLGGGSGWIGAKTSIFDPVLCELAYRWFSPKNAVILDPFAGGSVRGIVASILNRQYIGIDLREEQVIANQNQAINVCKDPMPVWKCGDSLTIAQLAKGVEADFVFSCPPYLDLEVYSDNPKDLSTMSYENFINVYSKIISESLSLLKEDRFACFVVGDVRDKKKGYYLNFVSETIRAFINAGALLYNESILVNTLGALPIRVGRQFSASRKLGKTHQNVLIFCKGDPKKATEVCGELKPDEFILPEVEEDEI